MNELQVFNFNEASVRVVMVDGEPWWVAKDVCDILELGKPRSSMALLEDDEKGVHSLDTLGGAQEMAIISEPGLYSLIMRSRNPEAKAFKRWIAHEVLPAIRETGGYKVPATFAEALRLAADIEEKRAALAIENAKKDQLIHELKPKADYIDSILNNPEPVYTLQIASDYGMSVRDFECRLAEYGVQHDLDGRWALNAKYQNKGHAYSEEAEYEHGNGRRDIITLTKWTQKGRLFLYEVFKEHGILPLIERK